MLAGRDIVMLSDGSPTRTFCYATDAITGYYKVLVRGRRRRAVQHRHRAAGDLDGRAGRARGRELARELFGYRGKVVLGKAQEADYLVDNPNRRCPVIDKARAQLGYDPKVLLDEGLRRSLIWYAHNRDAEAA